MSVELVYETHSITEDNEAGVATGWLPGRLSAQGRALAAELGQRRPARGFAAVWSSDLARAVETAQLAYYGTGVPLVTDARLRECDYGTLNGGQRVLLIAHSANRWALQHLLDGTPLGQVVTAPFAWQPGWEWTLA